MKIFRKKQLLNPRDFLIFAVPKYIMYEEIMAATKKIKTALVSVFHKDGLDELLAKLNAEGVKFLSTGGTRKFIESLGFPCDAVEDLTTYPSILGGRVKTLHPKVFGGILGRRALAEDQAEMAKYEKLVPMFEQMYELAKILKKKRHERGGIDFETQEEFRNTVHNWRKQRKMFRINRVSWWKEELPSDEEIQNAERNLAKVDFNVNYVLSHCAPQSIVSWLMGGFTQPDKLTMYFEDLARRLTFRNWFFGHYHDDRKIMGKFILLYDQIVRIT